MSSSSSGNKLHTCRRCGACCRQPGFVYLKAGEPEPLAAYLKLEVYEFTAAYCLLLNRRHLALQKHADETCVFLEEHGCSVYPVRPAQCRDFPLAWKTERSRDYCEGMKEIK